MDEQELRSLFSAAPGDAPEPTFSQDDVVRESRRQTVRHRNRITAGLSAAVLVVAGFGAYGVLSGSTPKSMTAANGDAVSSQSDLGSAQPGDGPMRPQVAGASGCDQVDRVLAIALALELPGHVSYT